MTILLWVLSILLVGALYQQISVMVERKKYRPLGKMIEVEGHKMHIYGQGEGSPTVVMTIGLGTACGIVDLYLVQERLSKHIRSVVYERPGYGWSEYASTSRAVEQITKELHLLLKASGEKPPYILVGHSMGSLEVLNYAQNYPEEVMVL